MPKYRVYAIASASWLLGEYEAENEDEARDLSQDDDSAEYHPSICHSCAGKIELGDAYKFDAEEVD